MKISTATSVLVNYPLRQAIEAVSEAGFDGVDVWCGRPHLYRQDHPSDVLYRLKHFLQSAGLQAVAAMPAFYRYPYSLSSPNEAVRSDSIAYVADCMANALAIDCPQVLIVPTRSLVGQSIEDARTRFLDALEQLSRRAERMGVRLGLEVLNPNLSDLVHTCAQAVEMIEAVGSDNLGIVLDTGHLCLSGEDFAGALATAGERLLEVHINDNDGQVQQNAIPGEGVVNFQSAVALLRARGYDGYLTLELGHQYTADPLPALGLALERTRALLDAE